MKKIAPFALLLAIVCFLPSFKSTDVNTTTTRGGTAINWMTWDEMAAAQAKEPRKVLIDFYTDWCGWCKKMDASTFSNEVIAKYVNEKYYAVKFDAEQKGDIVFKGRTFKFVANGRRGYHELAAEIMGGKMSYPTVGYLNESFGVIQAVPGFQTAKDMERIVKFFGDNAYESTSWEKYSADQTKFEIQ